MSAKILYLIDGHGFIFRAYHALPPLTRADGTPVNAVLGFCNILLRVLDEARDAPIAVVFDPAGPTFRNHIYSEYKANRSAPPEDLVPQFALIREATDAFGIEALEQSGFEADDLIATYTREAVERGYQVRIISSDKDLMQLVRDGVQLMDPLKFSLTGPDEVFAKFGVTPDKVTDVQALAGDSIDNIPGVRGIGIKTAAELINRFGSLENLLDNLHDIPQPKRRASLIEHADMARISKQLVTLDDRVALPKDFAALHPHVPDGSRLFPFLQEQGFRGVIARAEKKWRKQASDAALAATHPAQTATPDSTSNATAPEKNTANSVPQTIARHYTLVTDTDTLDQWIAAIRQSGQVAIDTETDNLTPARANLVGISLATQVGHACYIPVGHRQDEDLFAGEDKKFVQLALADVLARLKPVLEDPQILKIGQNIKYDWQIFAAHGITLAPLDDTMVMSYVLDGSLHGHGLDELARLHLHEELIPYEALSGKGKNRITLDYLTPEAVRDYACEDADMALRLYRLLAPRLVAEKKAALYHLIDKPVIRLLAEMEQRGIVVDPQVLQKLDAQFQSVISETEAAVFAEAGKEFNLASPKQLGDVLFNDMGIAGGKKTKTGAYSTDAKTLEELAQQGHSIVDAIIRHRQLAKLRSTYTQSLQQQINPRTGRVHTSYTLTVTNTGRLSSTDPNLQNIPIRTEEGRLIRTAFVAPAGHKLVSVDYSQIELRLVAEMAGLARLQQAFRDDLDIHALTASEVFDIPLADITPERRRAAKAINFGIIYGISGYGLARQLGTDNGTASAYIRTYMKRFPELADYMERTKIFAREHGYVQTLAGRIIHMPNIHSRNAAERAFAERQAINAPIQGTAADIMKLAMFDVDQALREAGLPARILLQVHDELVIECEESAVKETGELAQKIMQQVGDKLPVPMQTPLTVAWNSGDNWDQAH